MKLQRNILKRILFPVFGLIFALFALFSITTPAYADPVNPDAPAIATPENPDALPNPAPDPEAPAETEEEEEKAPSCYDQVDGVSWLVCPITNFFGTIIDGAYSYISDALTVKPMAEEQSTPIFAIWGTLRNIANILFVVFMLVCILSQVTTVGISNYGVKRTLPKLIIGAIMVNLSWPLCLLLIDASNVIGASLASFITSIATDAVEGGITISAAATIGTIGVGGVIAGVAIAAAGGFMGTFLALIPVIIGGLIAIIIAFFMVFLRQALVWLLLMVSPIAFVCYLLPNTEKWFQKWKQTFTQMLLFFPMIAMLFGGSRLVGWAIMATTGNAILGLAIQLFPLFYAFKLMQLSGTALGAIGGFLAGLGARGTSMTRNAVSPYQQAAKFDRLARNRAPSAKLQNYLMQREALRNAKMDDDKKAIEGRTNAAVARRYVKGYEVGKGMDQRLKPNKYARARRRAGNETMDAAIAAADTEHVINNYGDFFTSKTREELVKDNATQAQAAASNIVERTKAKMAQKAVAQDENLAKGAARGWVNYNRAMFTKQSDEENDFDFLVGQYLGYMERGIDSPEYKYYITSAAGGLGPRGASGIMGQLIAKADAVEQRKRRDDRILLNKFGFDKRQFRDMFVGYKTDDNGWALNANGDRLKDERGKLVELLPGQAWTDRPDLLQYWSTYDDDGRAYFDWKDQKGNKIMRVYKDDAAMMKEMLSNSDVPINDPINMLYASMASVDYGTVDPNDPSTFKNNVGIAKYSTTMGRAFLAAKYKEHASWGGPMYAEATGKRQIKNYAHNAIAMLDNIIKTNKPINFLQQDAQNIDFLVAILNPDNWDTIFTEANLEGLVNINDEPFTVKDADGKVIPNPTYEQKMGRLISKYLYPAAQKMADMVGKSSPRVIEGQKTNVAKSLDDLTTLFNEKWTDVTSDQPIIHAGNELKDPYVKAASPDAIVQDVRLRQDLHTRSAEVDKLEAATTKAEEELKQAKLDSAPEEEIRQKQAAVDEARKKTREAQLRLAQLKYQIDENTKRRERQASDFINSHAAEDASSILLNYSDILHDQTTNELIDLFNNPPAITDDLVNQILDILRMNPDLEDLADTFATYASTIGDAESALDTLSDLLAGRLS